MEVVWGIFFSQKFACFEIQIIWKQLVTQFSYLNKNPKTQMKSSNDFD